jgi:hypothetical protein
MDQALYGGTLKFRAKKEMRPSSPKKWGRGSPHLCSSPHSQIWDEQFPLLMLEQNETGESF